MLPFLPVPLGTPDHLANGLFQIAYVVPDMDLAVRYFIETMGAGRFFEMRDAPLRNQTYLGQPADPHVNIAFGYAGSLQIEIIQPMSGESTYSDFLARSPMGGLQHVGSAVMDFDAAVADYGHKGFQIVQTGDFGKSTRFGYVDTTRSVGHLTEIIYLDLETTALFKSIREETFSDK